MNKESFSHAPVMPQEVASFFCGVRIGTFVDATVGSGGHAEQILKEHQEANMIGIDLDSDILKEASRRLAPFSGRFRLFHGSYASLSRILKESGREEIDGLLLDLGASSLQLDVPERGFSFRSDARLDMRFDACGGERTAADIVNTEAEETLAGIFLRYGEEKASRRIARAVVKARLAAPIRTTGELAGAVRSAAGEGPEGGRSVTRIFQALRIAVNRELENLESVLPQALKALRPGGRMVVISFHSLEDRMVKDFFRKGSGCCICPEGLPVCGCGSAARLRTLTPRAVKASPEEQEKNPRSRSAKLRAAEKKEEPK